MSVQSPRTVGQTGITLSPLVFGGNVFGWTADQAASFAILDRLLYEARKLVRADAGTIFLVDGGDLVFSYVHNDSLFNADAVTRHDFDLDAIAARDYDIWHMQNDLFVIDSFDQLEDDFAAWCREARLG